MTKPWEQNWQAVIEDEDGEPVCYGIRDEHGADVVKTDTGVYPPTVEEGHLIAAAPELYRALRELLGLSRETDCGGLSVYERWDRVQAAAEAALAKARGEKT